MQSLKLVCGGGMHPFVTFPPQSIDKTHTKYASILMGMNNYMYYKSKYTAILYYGIV